MKKILLTALVLAGFSATAQVKVGSNPTTLATDAKFQVEGSTGAQTVILDNGNVGIGTTTPFHKLSVNGAIHQINGSGNQGLTFGQAPGSVDWNINKTFLSAPIIYDIRVFSNRNNGENVFLFLQTGQNIRWKNLTYGNGFSSKFGIGVILEPYDDVTFYVDIHKKSKEIELDNFTNLGFYRLNGFGISIGAIF